MVAAICGSMGREEEEEAEDEAGSNNDDDEVNDGDGDTDADIVVDEYGVLCGRRVGRTNTRSDTIGVAAAVVSGIGNASISSADNSYDKRCRFFGLGFVDSLRGTFGWWFD